MMFQINTTCVVLVDIHTCVCMDMSKIYGNAKGAPDLKRNRTGVNFAGPRCHDFLGAPSFSPLGIEPSLSSFLFSEPTMDFETQDRLTTGIASAENDEMEDEDFETQAPLTKTTAASTTLSTTTTTFSRKRRAFGSLEKSTESLVDIPPGPSIDDVVAHHDNVPVENDDDADSCIFGAGTSDDGASSVSN